MKKLEFYIGNTDYDWFIFLKNLRPDEINFWQPGGKTRFHAINIGEPFLFRLGKGINKIAGVGFFSSNSILPIDFAWEVFGEKNGVESLEFFRQKIASYRDPSNPIDKNPNIGCIILTNPVFFEENDWIEIPSWSRSIVQGRKYDMYSDEGNAIWEKVERILEKQKFFEVEKEYKNQLVLDFPEEYPNKKYSEEFLTRARLGQGAFRVMITDAYKRQCAVTGEKTLPVLDAAHIKPYDKSGPHSIRNGILLRTDIHKLFDRGYITITYDYRIEVSRKIKEEFDNGKNYYQFHGKSIITLPQRINDRPSRQFIEWHNQNVYKE